MATTPPPVQDSAEDDPRPGDRAPVVMPKLPVQDDMEDDPRLKFPLALPPGDSLVPHRWNLNDIRCCAPPAAPLVIDTHMHVWDEDPRPNRGINQLGLLEDVITESWGQGVHLGVLVQPGFRGNNNTYIERCLELFPGALSGEVEYLKDYPEDELLRLDRLGVRGLRFKATSLLKYEQLVRPRLESPEFKRIADFLKLKHWHYGVQLSKEAGSKWAEILSKLQATGVPIIIDMFGRPNPLLPTGADVGTQAIVSAAARKPPMSKIWMELGGPFRVDPRCTYAEPSAAEPKKCLPKDRISLQMRGTDQNRTLCCPPKTHSLLVELAELFIRAVGEDYVVWGTDWPFITDIGVTTQGLLDAVFSWVPNELQRHKVLGTNAVRPNAVGEFPMYPLREHLGNVEILHEGRMLQEKVAASKRMKRNSTRSYASAAAVQGLKRRAAAQDVAFPDNDQDEEDVGWLSAAARQLFSDLWRFDGTLVGRWRVFDRRCCTKPSAPLVIDTHMHVWDEDPRPNRGFNQLGLLEDVLTESWGVGIHLGVLVQPGFRDDNNSYILRSLERFPSRLSAEVEYVVDYDDEVLERMHELGTRGLRFKATSLAKYAALVTPRLESPEFVRIVKFMLDNDWHFGVQLAKEVGMKWDELLRVLESTGVPVIIDMFGRPDPMLAAGEDIGTQAILNAAMRGPPGRLWMEFGGPFRVDPRCTYADPAAANPQLCLPENRVQVPFQNGSTRPLCCPPQTHQLLVSLAATFQEFLGEEFLIWGTDWPFITDVGVTTLGLLDAMTLWVPDEAVRNKVLGTNAVRPNAVGGSPLFPLYWLLGEQTETFAEQQGIDAFAILILTLMPLSVLLGCSCEALRKYRSRSSGADLEIDGAEVPLKAARSGRAEKADEKKKGGVLWCPCTPWMSRMYDEAGEMLQERSEALDAESGSFSCLTTDLEPCHGFPPPTCRRPIFGDGVAAGMKAISELVGCLIFSALLTPDYLQPFLPVFLNYSMFGFIVSQSYYNLTTRYTTIARTCNISAAIFFLQILQDLRTDLAGRPDEMEITVNTLLMATTIMTWMAGGILWLVGTLRLTQFVRFLSAPVKLGMQGSLGYFLFATGFSISSGISWLDFESAEEFAIFFQVDILPKWIIALSCGLGIFFALKRWGWPYTIPTFVAVGTGLFYVFILIRGVTVEEAQDAGYLYPPPAGGGNEYNPFGHIFRIYDISKIDWGLVRKSIPAIATAAVVAPFLSAVINLVLMETTFTPEDVGRSTLAYELRQDGLTHWILALVGGYSTSPSAGGTAVHRSIGARTNWGLFMSVGVHLAFVLVPGSTSVLQFVPKFVVGAVGLIVAISMLDSGIRGGYAQLSLKEFTVVCITLLVSVTYGLEAGIALGWAFSFALFIQDTAATVPVRLDVDAGLVASHAVWGMRSSRLVARVRGAIRLISFQGYLFFAAIQTALKDIQKKHLQEDAALFLIADFSSVMGMDDSSPLEFKALAIAASKVGISLIFCGGGPNVVTKLRKAGVFDVGVAAELPDDEDLLEAARETASLEHSGVFVISSTDRAIEFCELTLALRSVELCPEALPPPSRELQALSEIFDTDLGQHRQTLLRGEELQREDGETFILIKGAVQATVALKDIAHTSERPEAIVVYRCVPGIEYDYCFSGSTPGTLYAVEDSEFLLLPKGALKELQKRGRWPEIEVVWSQLAEFMATAMHPMAMKATMHDVHGSYSSAAAEAFEAAVAEFEQAEGRRPSKEWGNGDEQGLASMDRRGLMRRVLAGSSTRMVELRKSITVNFAGNQPVFSSLRPRAVTGGSGGSSRPSSRRPSNVPDDVPEEDGGETPTGEARAPSRKQSRKLTWGNTIGARSRTSTAGSGAIYVGLDDDDDKQASDGQSEEDASVRGPVAAEIGRSLMDGRASWQWSVDQQFALCTEGQEAQFDGRAMLVDTSMASSVPLAIDLLSQGAVDCPDGFCVVYSKMSKAYFVVYADGMKQVAQQRLLATPGRPPPSSGRVSASSPGVVPQSSAGRSAAPSGSLVVSSMPPMPPPANPPSASVLAADRQQSDGDSSHSSEDYPAPAFQGTKSEPAPAVMENLIDMDSDSSAEQAPEPQMAKARSKRRGLPSKRSAAKEGTPDSEPDQRRAASTKLRSSASREFGEAEDPKQPGTSGSASAAATAATAADSGRVRSATVADSSRVRSAPGSATRPASKSAGSPLDEAGLYPRAPAGSR